MYDCETWRCEVADDGQGILAQDLNFVGQIGWTRYGMPTISNSWILNIFLAASTESGHQPNMFSGTLGDR
jgi:hypothetical protein